MSANRMFLTVVFVVSVAAIITSQSRTSRDWETIEGTWIVDITPTGQQTRQILTTFARGGSVVGSGNNPMPILRSSWHGVWDRVAYRDFVSTLERWNFDAAENFTGRTELRQVIVVDPTLEQFSGGSKTPVLDPSGNFTSDTSATFRATRRNVQPLE